MDGDSGDKTLSARLEPITKINMINHFYTEIAHSFPHTYLADDLASISVMGSGNLPSWFAVSDLATASIATAGLMLSRLISTKTDSQSHISVDRRLASFWFKSTLRPIGWEMPAVWNKVAGIYRTTDGWIRLHTNVPAHRAAALSVLSVPEDRDAVTKAVAGWERETLMNAIVEAGGCAAALNSIDEWQQHPQGAAVAQEPLIHWAEHGAISSDRNTTLLDPSRPLAGLRVLDLTRILAGPISTRFLAAYGADVLRIDPPGWNEPGNIPEVVLGKRCACLDLRQTSDRSTFETLVQRADLLVHGYRPGALAGLGYGPNTLRGINPSLINVSLNAYGWTGPWATRRGFDSLVQMSSGIADFGMKQEDAGSPIPLPAQALDHATGYLLAAAALHALHRRQQGGTISSARLSLARVAHLLIPTRLQQKSGGLTHERAADLAPDIEETTWGDAQRIRFPLAIGGIEASWPYPARALCSAKPIWV